MLMFTHLSIKTVIVTDFRYCRGSFRHLENNVQHKVIIYSIITIFYSETFLSEKFLCRIHQILTCADEELLKYNKVVSLIDQSRQLIVLPHEL